MSINYISVRRQMRANIFKGAKKKAAGVESWRIIRADAFSVLSNRWECLAAEEEVFHLQLL